MLACIGKPKRSRTLAIELIAHQKWSTWRTPALYARTISVQLEFEWPHVTR